MAQFSLWNPIRYSLSAMLLCCVAPALSVTFDFESTSPLSNAIIGGDKVNFPTTTTFARSGTKSLHFRDFSPEPYESWTYDLPAGLQAGTVSLWFRESIDDVALAANTWGLSVLVEDTTNTVDWGAVEIAKATVGGQTRYFGSEGSVDRLASSVKFDSTSFPTRNGTVWHEIRFDISTTVTLISVDGIASTQVAAPGSESAPGVPRSLRLRFLGDSPSIGAANKNWRVNTADPSFPAARRRVFIDDIAVTQTLPSALSKSVTFEVIGGVPDYDTKVIQSVAPKTDIPEIRNLINVAQLETSSTFVRNGAQSVTFDPLNKRRRGITFDLANVVPNTTTTLYFYDNLGNDQGQNKFGGSVIVESGINPATFVALEIWNFNFPATTDPTPGPKNYYVSVGTAGSPNTGAFNSRYFGDRSIGWHKVEIYLTSANSRIVVDGLQNTQNTTLRLGPGLSTSPKLRLLADSASNGGFGNYVGVDELDAITDADTSNVAPYVYYDDIDIPLVTPSGVKDWSIYE